MGRSDPGRTRESTEVPTRGMLRLMWMRNDTCAARTIKVNSDQRVHELHELHELHEWYEFKVCINFMIRYFVLDCRVALYPCTLYDMFRLFFGELFPLSLCDCVTMTVFSCLPRIRSLFLCFSVSLCPTGRIIINE